MATAEIVAIGTELLLGEIQDTNTQFLARRLRDAGIDLYRTTIVGDNENRIASVLQEALGRADIVITSGGLGPTIDDPTRQAVAKALGVELEFRPELWEQIRDRFRRFNRSATENNRRQAYIPTGATAIENPVGTAPAFFFDLGQKLIASVPGVPRELEHLIDQAVLPLLKAKFGLQETIRTCVLHTAGVGESQVDEWVSDFETRANPTVGLAAHPGQIDIRITAKGSDPVVIDRQIAEVAGQIRARVGNAIYGENGETLESVVLDHLAGRGWRLLVVECGMGETFSNRLNGTAGQRMQIKAITSPCEPDALKEICLKAREDHQVEVVLGAVVEPADHRQILTLFFSSPAGERQIERSYGGPPQNAGLWSVNTVLDFARRQLNR